MITEVYIDLDLRAILKFPTLILWGSGVVFPICRDLQREYGSYRENMAVTQLLC